MCFPFCRIHRPGAALQAASATPQLTLAMPTIVALATPFLMNHRVAATLGTEVAGDA